MPEPNEPGAEPALDETTVALVESQDGGRDKADAEAMSLVVMSPSFTATYALPPAGVVTIGRAKSVEIYVDDKSVSRSHAVISTTPRLTVRDLGSSNGTRVGSIKIAPEVPHPLQLGDAIVVGSATI